jgi:hypothetical protein
MNRSSKEQLARINEELLRRVAVTKAAYEQSKSAAIELRALREQLGAVHSDGTRASLTALRTERAAIRAYTDAIKALTEFTLQQNVPEGLRPQLHSPNVGHFSCRCGEHLAFGTEASAWTLLVNQRREGNRKIGECPRCGCVHEVPPVRPLAG